jgi:isopentenyl-diphosphate delta-isomerase
MVSGARPANLTAPPIKCTLSRRGWHRCFVSGYHAGMDEFHDGSVATASAADRDSLILVDEADRRVGHLSKVLCHEGRGILHRAFSLLIFNERGELLLQQRSSSKRLWPLYWSNSCCSHPRRAETMEAAIHRRLSEELGLRCPLHFLFKFQYQAQFDATGAENELCSVFIGRSTDTVKADSAEILAWRWVSPEALQREMAAGAGNFTPWFMLEWTRVWRDHRAQVYDLQSELGSEARSR